MKKALSVIALGAAAVLALSACTDSAAPQPGPDTGNETVAEMRTVRVAALPIAETGALWAAMEEGIFAKHNIEVEVVPAQGGAQAIPGLLNGDIEFAIGQPFGPYRAALADLGAPIISNYASSLGADAEKDVNAVVALNSSGITGPADLAGKRVSVNSLGAAGDVTIMKAVKDAGGDPSTIEFVMVAFPDAKAQLEANNIDAAWVPDPFMSMVAGDDGLIVMHPYQVTIPELSLLTNITTQKLIDENPDLVKDYAAAMAEALDWAQANPDLVRAAIVENMGIPEAAAAGITLPLFTAEIDQAGLETLAELAVEFGVLDTMPDFSVLLKLQ
jgi:NitT/TauT family transport system substrate-binding protein